MNFFSYKVKTNDDEVNFGLIAASNYGEAAAKLEEQYELNQIELLCQITNECVMDFTNTLNEEHFSGIMNKFSDDYIW